jgi:hypothetical protein
MTGLCDFYGKYQMLVETKQVQSLDEIYIYRYIVTKPFCYLQQEVNKRLLIICD